MTRVRAAILLAGVVGSAAWALGPTAPRVVAVGLASPAAEASGRPGRSLTSPDSQTVTFTTRDGVTLTGTLYLPDRTPAPGVVLLHMAMRTRADWDSTGQACAREGLVAFAVDFRRSGAAAAGEGDTPASGGFSDLVIDADAARAYLAARPEVAATRLGMAGASLGANVAVLAASNDPSIRSLALLSPSLDYRGLRIEQALTRFGSRPALLVASSEDPFALRTARTLVTAGDGARELRVLSEAGHGTVMLTRHPELVDAVVDWFSRTLL